MTCVAARIEPRERTCACGAAVLVTEHGPLELPEVYPETPCGPCRGRGHRGVRVTAAGTGPRRSMEPGDMFGATVVTSSSCPDCMGTGRQGEPLTAGMVLLDAYGRVRDYDGGRQPGEAAYRRHDC